MGLEAVTIRMVEPRDQEAIARMWEALSAYHTQLDSRMPQMAKGAPAAYASRLVEVRSDAQTRAFVAEVRGAVVGYVLGAVVDLMPDLFEHEDVGFVADIYVEPDHRLSLSADEPVLFSRPSIDVLFESAADAYGESLVGVILSGANGDGSRGLRSIWESGGVALVEDPHSARASAMPQAALDACPEARVMSLERIAEFMVDLYQGDPDE